MTCIQQKSAYAMLESLKKFIWTAEKYDKIFVLIESFSFDDCFSL